MTDEPAPPTPCPIDEEQLGLVIDAVDLVAGSPSACGEVIITIKGGIVAYVTPAPSLAARSGHLTQERLWLWDRMEKKGRRTR